jgi:hypothetical protein
LVLVLPRPSPVAYLSRPASLAPPPPSPSSLKPSSRRRRSTRSSRPSRTSFPPSTAAPPPQNPLRPAHSLPSTAARPHVKVVEEVEEEVSAAAEAAAGPERRLRWRTGTGSGRRRRGGTGRWSGATTGFRRGTCCSRASTPLSRCLCARAYTHACARARTSRADRVLQHPHQGARAAVAGEASAHVKGAGEGVDP